MEFLSERYYTFRSMPQKKKTAHRPLPTSHTRARSCDRQEYRDVIIKKTLMTRTLTKHGFAAVLLFACTVCGLAAPAPKKPKLVLLVVVDQFRYDYLLRFRNDYTAGLKRLLDQGAVFDDAHYIHYTTMTAQGHSTLLSGAPPSLSGIIQDTWYERGPGKTVTSVSDDDTKLVGGSAAIGSSPRRLTVSTLGDEIKMQGQQVKVIGISTKDRGSVLTAGHMADSAYWFDAPSGHWVTSTYYMNELPPWVAEVNASKPTARAENTSWMPLNARPGDKPFCTTVKSDASQRYCGAFERTPWGNEMIEELAERALTAEKLGHHDGTDVFSVSFSSNDYIGHDLGPDSPEVRDISIRTDRLIGKLLDQVDKQVGLSNTIVVFSADHGVSPSPEVQQQRKMPGGRTSPAELTDALERVLGEKYGPGKWVLYNDSYGQIYLNREVAAKYKVTVDEVSRTAVELARTVPHVFRAYTAEEIRNGRGAGDPVTMAVAYGYYGSRSGDLFVLYEPYYVGGTSKAGSTHSTAFDYDNHVPVIFLGTGIKPGHYFGKIAVNDVAPTLAAIAGVETPSGSIGRVLQEMWQ